MPRCFYAGFDLNKFYAEKSLFLQNQDNSPEKLMFFQLSALQNPVWNTGFCL